MRVIFRDFGRRILLSSRHMTGISKQATPSHGGHSEHPFYYFSEVDPSSLLLLMRYELPTLLIPGSLLFLAFWRVISCRAGLNGPFI